jgi:hypothetical protein
MFALVSSERMVRRCAALDVAMQMPQKLQIRPQAAVQKRMLWRKTFPRKRWPSCVLFLSSWVYDNSPSRNKAWDQKSDVTAEQIVLLCSHLDSIASDKGWNSLHKNLFDSQRTCRVVSFCFKRYSFCTLLPSLFFFSFNPMTPGLAAGE